MGETIAELSDKEIQEDLEKNKPATLVIDDRNLSAKQKNYSTPVAPVRAQDTRPVKDNWDKLAAMAPIISGVIIFAMGGYVTSVYNQQQLKLQEIQTIEKFIPHLMGNEQSKKAAILAMSQLTNPELAGKFANIFASTGTVSALQSMVDNGNAHEKNIATKALSDAMESLAARENRLTEIQAKYQQELQTKDNQKSKENDQEYMHTLNQLGEVYKLKGEGTLAEPLLKKSLIAREKLYGNDHPQVAEALRSLAEIYEMNGNSAEAANCMRRARTIEAKYAAASKTEAESAAPSAPSSHSALVREATLPAEIERPHQDSKALSAPAEAKSSAEEKHPSATELTEESKLQ